MQQFIGTKIIEAEVCPAWKASGEYHPGSIAYVAEEGLPAHMVNASGEWKAV